MPESANIIEFSNVTLPGVEHGQIEMRNATFTLGRGALMLVRVETGREHLPLADAAEGLAAPSVGTIRWQGRDWDKLAADEEPCGRAYIGRVFEKQGWLSNLNVLENVTLSQRHHTARPETEIMAEADALARQFGMKEVPRQRPAFVPRRDLRIAEWIRALVGKPLLLLLERPEAGVPADDNLPKLIDAVQAALRRGAAAIWQTDQNAIWGASIWTNEIRYRMQGANMVLVKDKTS